MKPTDLFLVFDVESVGLHGEGFAVGFTVVNGKGQCLSENILACPLTEAKGSDADRAWVLSNVPPIGATQPTPQLMRDAFWRCWMNWKAQGAILVADCCWPVEARFLAACVDDAPAERNWEGPYPLHDLASVLLANGKDPLATTERLPDELPAHNPLNDARQSARILLENLTKPTA